LGADRAIVTAIYPSREDPIEGVDSNLVIEAAKRSGHRHVTFCEQWANAGKELAEHVGPGDVILTLGAGDIYRLGEMLAGEGAQ
jgi:UDP-N-acetylmuramate--alanine ligase